MGRAEGDSPVKWPLNGPIDSLVLFCYAPVVKFDKLKHCIVETQSEHRMMAVSIRRRFAKNCPIVVSAEFPYVTYESPGARAGFENRVNAFFNKPNLMGHSRPNNFRVAASLEGPLIAACC